jgi:hypothetical protein
MHLTHHRGGHRPAVPRGRLARRWLARAMVLLVAVGTAGWCLTMRSASPAQALANNLALTPPMGWNGLERPRLQRVGDAGEADR